MFQNFKAEKCCDLTESCKLIHIHIVVFAIIEIQRTLIVRHNNLTPHNNVLHVSVHQNHH